MPTTVNLKRLLHKKTPELCNANPAGNTAAGTFIVSDKSDIVPGKAQTYFVGGVSSIWNYHADEDAWIAIPPSGIAGTFAAGSCGEFRALSAPGGSITLTATAGSTTTLTTNLTITRGLKDVAVRVVGGAGSGYIGKVSTNTMGANSILTVTPASSVAFNNTTQFQIFGGSLWFFNAGTTAVGFAVYDRITNAWTQRSVTGLPTAWGTDAQIVSTDSASSNGGLGFVNDTATAGAASTLTTDLTFLLNQWANYQIRIISGTGAGQIRTIASNTAGANSVITVSSAWTTVPDATSVFRIEGNDDFFYLLGNNAVTMYRYSISGNTWTTLSPTAARAGAYAAGGTADWIDSVQDSTWSDGSYASHIAPNIVKQLGRYIYSFRGGASSILDVYDIALNTWYSGISYGNQLETFTTGTNSVDMNGKIYIMKEATGRIYKFDVALNELQPFTISPVPQGAAVAGDKMFIQSYIDGATTIIYLYMLAQTSNVLTRYIVF